MKEAPNLQSGHMISLVIILYVWMLTSNRLKTLIITIPVVKFGNDPRFSFGVINTCIYAQTTTHRQIITIQKKVVSKMSFDGFH